MEEHHLGNIPDALVIKQDMTKDLQTIFSDLISVNFKKGRNTTNLKGQWYLICKYVIQVSRQTRGVLTEFRAKKHTIKGVKGRHSSQEGTPAVEHTFVSITRSTVNTAKKKTYVRITTFSHDHYTRK